MTKTRDFLISLDAGAGELDRETVTVTDGDDDEIRIREAVLRFVGRCVLAAGDTIKITEA